MRHEADTLTLSRAIAQTEAALREKGLLLQFGRDFNSLEGRIRSAERNVLTEHFRRSLNTHLPPLSFWLAMYEGSEIAGYCAARLDELGTMSLGEYWREYWPRCYADTSGAAVELAALQPAFSEKIAGRVVYMGDVFVSPNWRRDEVGGVGALFGRLVILLAYQEWRPDYLYGWMRPHHVLGGYAAACGFTRMHPQGIRWQVPPATIDPDLYVVGISASEVEDFACYLSGGLQAGSCSTEGCNARAASERGG